MVPVVGLNAVLATSLVVAVNFAGLTNLMVVRAASCVRGHFCSAIFEWFPPHFPIQLQPTLYGLDTKQVLFLIASLVLGMTLKGLTSNAVASESHSALEKQVDLLAKEVEALRRQLAV